MASNPTVTLTMAGDEKKLTDAFDRVGKASQDMASKVDDASDDMKKASASTDSLVESADGAESKFIGFTDTLSGAQGILQGLSDDSLSFGERLAVLGQAGADLAGGFASLIIPALTSFWTTLTTTVIPAVWSFTTALLANPITWVVLGIAALIAILYALGVRWDDIKNIVSGVINWIVDRWNGLMAWFGGIPAWFGRIFGGIGDAIAGAFKSAINWIIDRLNWFVDRANDLIYGINLVNPFDDIPAIPHIPKLHTGGVVPGQPGTEVPIMAMAGEHVSANGQGGSEFVIRSGGTALDDALVEVLRAAIQRQGGNVQAVLGT